MQFLAHLFLAIGRIRPLFAVLVGLGFTTGFTTDAYAQDAKSEVGVTDLTLAKADSIGVGDIVEALAVSRGTRIEAGALPTVRLPVYFEFDSTQLLPEAVVLLEKVSNALATEELGSFRFSIEGHTDSVGSDQYNLGLSTRRANAVVDFIASNGVPEQRLASVGHGESQPVASNVSDEDRQRNRRVELINLGAR